MAEPGVVEGLTALLGHPVVVGTLNVRVQRPFERAVLSRYLDAPNFVPGWRPPAGQIGYRWAPVLIADRYRGLAFRADEDGYPEDLVELVSEIHLRSALGLRDGDPIVLRVLTG